MLSVRLSNVIYVEDAVVLGKVSCGGLRKLIRPTRANLDQQTAEHFAQTVNKLKGKVTILFITHQLPKGLNVDEAVILGKEKSNQSEQQQTTMPQNNQQSSNAEKVET